MEMQGERRIRASREIVWKALNEPEVLKASIPGCEELEQTSDTTFEGKVNQKVGPVKARFQVNVELSDIEEAKSYRISGEGKGGAAGFAKGGAKVTLEDDGEGTLLSYDVEAKVGGKLAQLGSRIIDGYAKKMADQFFDRFKTAVEPPEEEEAEEGAEAANAEQTAGDDSGEGPEKKGEGPEKKKGWFRRMFG
jgi:carbon monoxide dehydrogenase subunit G